MPYRIRFTQIAKKEIGRLPGNIRQRARHMVDALADEPRPHGSKELRDEPGVYRQHLDGWRVIYEVDDESHTVVILTVRRKVGPETYENIPR